MYDKSGRIIKQADDYLVVPIRLEVKLTQNDPETALRARESLISLFIGLDEFGVTVQKGQYDNVQMLLELTSDYMRFLNSDTMKSRKNNLDKMNQLLEQNGHEASITSCRTLFKQMFGPQLEIIINSDPKKPEKLLKALSENL